MAAIDRLIDEGLNLYGLGDLDGALEAWEEALAIDPDNPQANSYVDYVRQNYDILATDAGVALTDQPFGIEAEPEYVIEITPGDIDVSAHEPLTLDSDEGWFIDDDDPNTVQVGRTKSRDQVVEIEADEPPLAASLSLAASPSMSSDGISFEDATREYVGRRPPTNEFLDEPSSFRAESTPLGFGTQDTEVKKRSTGFVQPVPRPKPPTPATPATPVTPAAPAPSGELTTNAELRVRVRTPASQPPPSKPAQAPEPLPAPTSSSPDPPALDLAVPELELGPPGGRDVTARIDVSSEDLLASLPVPRRLTPVRGSRISQSLEVEPAARIPTRDLPGTPRPPADRETSQEIALTTAKTRDLTRDASNDASTDEPLDFGPELDLEPPRTTLPVAPIGGDDPVIGVPTRELGLRSPAPKRAPSVFPDEEATTSQTDARQIRQEAAARDIHKTLPFAGEGTRKDIVLAFDPIDARSTQILAEIDGDDVPPAESKDDRVRRRISGLLMRAAEWNAGGELDKAVTAVDLALSEEPTSALAQKLLHRNREAIMLVFQTYLGDLERQPQLAKPLHELAAAPISPRAAFLLSRIDGMLSIDEILDVSGMPRLEAYRHLCQLFLRGILR